MVVCTWGAELAYGATGCAPARYHSLGYYRTSRSARVGRYPRSLPHIHSTRVGHYHTSHSTRVGRYHSYDDTLGHYRTSHSARVE
eukprot:1276292-Rhodomonas_salina.1